MNLNLRNSFKRQNRLVLLFGLAFLLHSANSFSANGADPFELPDDFFCPFSIIASSTQNMAESQVAAAIPELNRSFRTILDYLWLHESQSVQKGNVLRYQLVVGYVDLALGTASDIIKDARTFDPNNDQLHNIKNLIHLARLRLAALALPYRDSIERIMSNEDIPARHQERESLKGKMLPDDVYERAIAELQAVLSQLALAIRECRQIVGEASSSPEVVSLDANQFAETVSALTRVPPAIRTDIPWTVTLSTSELSAALANLVENSVLAGSSSDQITISADLTFISSPPVSSQTGLQRIVVPKKPPSLGHFLAISISDKGSGMDSQTLEKLFTGYTGRPEQGGTGLGTRSVLGFVERQGGWIKINSVVGQGSTFTLYIPAYVTEQEATARSSAVVRPPAPAGAKPPKKILIIDDAPAQRHILSRLVENLGGVAVAVESRAEAIKLLRQGRTFNIIITDYLTVPEDISLSDFSSYASTQARVVLLSGMTLESLPPGVSEQVEKPLSLPQFEKLLKDE